MITSPQINDHLIRQVLAIRARPGWTHPLETVNGRRVLPVERVREGKAA